MKIKWEKRKVFIPTCPNCKEELQGNNSYIFPYECRCGIWKATLENPSEYKLMVKSK